MRARNVLRSLCLLAALSGCQAGDGTGLNQNGRPLAEGSSLPLNATFESLQANVFDLSCAVSGCHAGATAPLGLQLGAGNSYARLVGQASAQRPDLLRVAPGDPDNSYLVHKIEGIATVGGRMPLDQSQLSDAAIAAVRQWISEGAEPAGNSDLPRVVTTTPAGGGLIAELPAAIEVVFNRAMDAATLNNTTVLLERAGTDQGFSEGNEVAVAATGITLSGTGLDRLSIDLSGIVSVDDLYRLRLLGTGSAPIQDAEARILDGDVDGSEGGDFVTTFDVGNRFVNLQPTLASIQDLVFTPVCVQCHFGNFPAGGLNLETGNSFAGLVNQPREFANEIRVIPGDADNSFIVWKLEGTQLTLPSQGERMPLGGPFLPQPTIDVIRAWIDAGANP